MTRAGNYHVLLGRDESSAAQGLLREISSLVAEGAA